MPYLPDHHPPDQEYWPSTAAHGGSYGDLRERLRTIEVLLDIHHRTAQQRLDAQVGRMNGIDGRLQAGDQRMAGHQERLTEQGFEIARIKEATVSQQTLEARVSAMEKGREHLAQIAKYGVAAVLLFLTLTGRMTVAEVEQLWKIFTHAP